MKRISLFLKEKQIRKLKVLAIKQEEKMAFLIRRAIDIYLKAFEDDDPSWTKETGQQTKPVRRGPVRKKQASGGN